MTASSSSRLWIGDRDTVAAAAAAAVAHYAPQQHLMAITANVSGAVLGFVVDVGQRRDDVADELLNGGADQSGDTDDDAAAALLMPLWAYHSAAVYLLFVSVLGLIMNVIVVIVILNDPQRTPLNWMLLNLALSDGTIAGFGTPMSTAAALQTGWHFSHELCVAYAMIMSTAGIGSITTLSALALWRCTLVVCCPAKRNGAFNSNTGKLGRRQAALLLTLIWTYALAVTSPPLFGWGRYDREAAHISCSVNWESKMDNNRSYILYMFAMGLIVPLVVIVVSYASILRVVRKTGEIKRKTLTTLQTNLTGHVQQLEHRKHINNNNQQQQQHSDAAERRVTVMVACMIGAFMAAWTPYSILALIETFGGVSGPGHRPADGDDDDSGALFAGSISPALATVPSLFAKTSAVLNPLIYGLLNTQFRSAWEKFSLRFLGRRRRGHHHHHHRHHRNNPASQEMMVNVTSTERRNLRRLLEFHRNLQPSPTVQLPMKEIVPVSSSAYAMVTQQGSEMAPPSPAAQQHQQNHEEAAASVRPSPSFLMSAFSTSSSSSSSVTSAPPEASQQQQQQQPVSLVVVRLLSDSASCCTDDVEDSVLETSLDASSSVVRQTPSLRVKATSLSTASIHSPKRQSKTPIH